jgi:hypothetical protein
MCIIDARTLSKKEEFVSLLTAHAVHLNSSAIITEF